MNRQFSPQLLATLRRAREVVVFTGAGISAESGVPTFRGNEGIWAKFKPEELASFDAFMRNPALVWEWYAQRKKVISSVMPNDGHRALAAMERLFDRFTVVTQNIDNLHRRAGSTRVFELHGNIERNYCVKCGSPYGDADILVREGVPSCTREVKVRGSVRVCGGLIRPDVVWFGEFLPEDAWKGAVRAIESADALLSVGTSGVVYPAASLPLMAKQQGVFLVEINPEETPLTPLADHFLRGAAGEILPALVHSLQQRGQQNQPEEKEIR